MFFDISEDAFLESFDAGKDAAPELILGQVAEESFNHVEPTAAGGREVKMKALVARRPALNRRVFVGGIVVDDKVELFVGGRLAIDHTQETLRAVTASEWPTMRGIYLSASPGRRLRERSRDSAGRGNLHPLE